MSLVYQRHEPASIKNNLFDWIRIDKSNPDGFDFLEKSPNNIQLLNRYLIEDIDAIEFINFLAKSYEVLSCLKLSHKSLYLTKIQRLFREKNLRKEGWDELVIKKGIFLKECKNVDSNHLEVARDYYFDSIYIVSKDKKSAKELIYILDSIDFLNQPKKLDTFCPTEQFIDGVIENKIVVIFHKRNFVDIDCSKERLVFICYSAWKI